MRESEQGLTDSEGRGMLPAILFLYLLLALAYGLVNPLFEAPDEHWHYFTAQYVAEHGRLPMVSDPPDEWLGQEAAQPPLYYVLGSLLVRLVDTEGARQVVWPNPLVKLGDASAPNNVNAFVHGPWEWWPWRGYALAVHLLRALSSLLGLGTLLFIYGSGRLLWPEQRRALLATGLAAFLPQFLFIHSAISNDSLITFLSAATLWQLLRVWYGRLTRGRLLLLGVTVGLAILSKTAGLLLLAYAVGVLLLRTLWRRDRLWPLARDTALFLVLPAAILAGWLLWRNWALYGDVTAANQFVRIAGGDRRYTLLQVLAETPGLWTSLIALFGWFNVRAPGWVYGFWNGLALLALVGAVAAGHRWARRGNAPGLHADTVPPSGREPGTRTADGFVVAAWLVLWVLLVYGGLLVFMLRTPAAQGRLLFPALLPLVLGAAFGLDRLWRFSWSVALPVAFVTALYCLLAVLPDAYARPLLLEGDELPADTVPSHVAMEQDLELLGYHLGTPVLEPGDVAWLTLYWRTAQVPLRAPRLVVELFGRQEALVGKYEGYHGGGLYPANLWPPERIVADRIGLRLAQTATVPTEIRVQAGLVGALERHTIASLKAIPPEWPAAPRSTVAQLGEGIELVEASLQPARVAPGEPLTVMLAWRVTEDVEGDYTTLVHLGDPRRPPLAQGDSPPLWGDYPTPWWQAGEVIRQDRYALTPPDDIVPGRYPLLVGMYDPQSGQRLPLVVAGERQDHDAYRVGWVTVE